MLIPLAARGPLVNIDHIKLFITGARQEGEGALGRLVFLDLRLVAENCVQQ